jgi:hypothetical protein
MLDINTVKLLILGFHSDYLLVLIQFSGGWRVLQTKGSMYLIFSVKKCKVSEFGNIAHIHMV